MQNSKRCTLPGANIKNNSIKVDVFGSATKMDYLKKTRKASSFLQIHCLTNLVKISHYLNNIKSFLLKKTTYSYLVGNDSF